MWTCLRSLRRAPVVAAVIVLSVGLGIGATTTVFTAVNAALLRPLPYADPGHLVRIYTDSPPNRFPFSVADFRALTAQQTTFAGIAAYRTAQATFTNGAVAERVKGRGVSPGYFTLFGITPAQGRTFTSEDGRPGGPRVVVVSHAFLEHSLAGPDAIGKPVRLDGVDYTLIGVLGQRVGPLEQGQDYFVPEQWPEPARKGPFFLTVVGRLRPDTKWADAAAELHGINTRLFPVWHASYQDDRATWNMMDLKAHVVGDVSATAGVALAAAALVWLIACANASNLLIAGVAARRREFAVRTALGASRARVIRHLLAESAVLAGAAAVVGALLGWAGIDLLRHYGGAYFPRTTEIALDSTAALAILSLAVSSTLLFGLVPALHGIGGSADEALRAEGRSATGSVGVRRLRRALVAAEFVIATPLLVLAALLLVSLNHLGRVDLGFDTHHVLTAQLTLPGTHNDPGITTAAWDEIQRRVSSVPAVSGVALSDGRPPADVGNFNNFDLEDAPTPPGHSQPVTPWIAVTPGYFQVLGLPLIEGRLLDDRDARPGSQPVVVVDRAWAQRFFPNQRVVGRRFRSGGCTTCPLTTVVGIVRDVKYVGLDKPDDGSVYQPISPQVRSRMLIMRTSADPAIAVSAVREAIREYDPALPLYGVATIDDLLERSLDRPRSLSLLIGCLAASALTLSIVGIYGVMAYHVQQQAKEIGIRIALGGNPRSVLAMVVGQGMRIVAAGTAIGLIAALAAARLTSSLLFGVGAGDPATVGGVAALLFGTALAACLVPALRVTRLQPAVVLRND